MLPEDYLIKKSTKILIKTNFNPNEKEVDKELEEEGYEFFDRKYIIDMFPIIIEHLKKEILI